MIKRILLKLMRLTGFTAIRIGKLDAERNQAAATAHALHEAHVARDRATAQLDQERLLRHSAEAVRDETVRSYGEAERMLTMVRARESTLESLVGHLEGSNKRLQQGLDDGRAEIEQLQAARQSLKDEIDSFKVEIERRQLEAVRLESEVARLTAAAAALAKEAAQRDILAGALKEAEVARDEAVAEAQRANEARRTLEELRTRDPQPHEELKSALAQARAASDAFESEIRVARERVEAAELAAKVQNPASQAELAAAQAAYSRAVSDLADAKRSLADLRIEYLDHLRLNRGTFRRPRKAKPASGSR